LTRCGVVDHQLDCAAAFLLGAIEQCHDIGLFRRIAGDGGGAAAVLADRGRHFVDLLGRAPADEDMHALAREALAERAAQAGFGADADDDRLGCVTHRSSPP
jgi:hypothetical protein